MRFSRIGSMVVSLLVLVVLVSASARGGAQASPILNGLRSLMEVAPFSTAVVWDPPAVPSDTLLLLHGKQASSTADPTWMAWLRTHSPFDRYRLIVPAFVTSEWNQPDSISRLRLLLEQNDPHNGMKSRRWLVGFSAGASRGFGVAAALGENLAGFAACAGAAPPSLSKQQLKALAQVPVLLVCMEQDQVVPCDKVKSSADMLRKAGLTRVTFQTLPHLGHECELGTIAPVLDGWMQRVVAPPR